jgi:hypothetical protein
MIELPLLVVPQPEIHVPQRVYVTTREQHLSQIHVTQPNRFPEHATTSSVQWIILDLRIDSEAVCVLLVQPIIGIG